MRLGVKAALELGGRIEVSGEAEEAEQALLLAERLGVDLVIVDLRLGGKKDGLDLCRDIKSLADPPHVLIYTAHNSREDVHVALSYGADSFVHKGEAPAALRQAIVDTCAGKRLWLLGSKTEEAKSLSEIAENVGLTPREREVHGLVAKGYSNAQIASELGVSVSTVKTHVGHILDKLNADDRGDLQRGDPLA